MKFTVMAAVAAMLGTEVWAADRQKIIGTSL
jgi:hypothetical protein